MVTNNSCDYQPTQYNVQTGGASGTLNNVSPSSTSGVPVISQGSASQPIFGTAVVAGGGTGATSFNTNGAIISGTSGTAALAAVSLSLQQFLVGNTSAAPTAKALSVVQQVFTATGSSTYTPTSGMVYCIVECQGGGGGGGGAVATSATQYSGGGGGGAGEYRCGAFSASSIGASQTVTINTGGGGNAGANGSDGGTVSLGALMTANAGGGGPAGTAGITFLTGNGSSGAAGSGGSFAVAGGGGQVGYGVVASTIATGGDGADSWFGARGRGRVQGTGAGTNSIGHGSGGGGAVNLINQASTLAGGNGQPGMVVITEFVIS